MTSDPIRFLAALLAAAALLSLNSCLGGEEPVLISIPIEAASAQPAAFQTAAGYDVELDEGVVVLGALLFNEPAEVASAPRRPWQLFAPAVAHAHPGHDMAGDVQGEWAGTTFVDLLAPPAIVGDGSFYEGSYETASLDLLQDGVDGDAGLEAAHPAAGHTLYLSGTADDGNGSIPFEFVVDHTKTILGLPFEATVAQGDAPTVTLLVDPAEILGHLAFADLDDDGDGQITQDDENASNPLMFGVESTLAYAFEIN